MDTATRLLRLLAMLHSRPFWTCDELADRLEVTPRTVRRDVARLRELGHPVEATRGRHGGYQLGQGDTLPPLVLDDHEALAVVVGLRMAATGAADGLEETAVAALAKLERVLPERLRERVHDLATATVMVGGGPAAATDPDSLITLAQACRRRERVRFLYRARGADPTYRHAEPYRLVHAHGRWYLVAYDLDRDDWRTFRVDRASSPLHTGARSTEREEPDAGELVREALAVAPYDVHATVRLQVPFDEASRFVSGWGVIEPAGDDATILRLGGADVESIARWLPVLPCPFEVLDPPEVRDALHRRARALLDA